MPPLVLLIYNLYAKDILQMRACPIFIIVTIREFGNLCGLNVKG
jgi:hypothetical protein